MNPDTLSDSLLWEDMPSENGMQVCRAWLDMRHIPSVSRLVQLLSKTGCINLSLAVVRVKKPSGRKFEYLVPDGYIDGGGMRVWLSIGTDPDHAQTLTELLAMAETRILKIYDIRPPSLPSTATKTLLGRAMDIYGKVSLYVYEKPVVMVPYSQRNRVSYTAFDWSTLRDVWQKNTGFDA